MPAEQDVIILSLAEERPGGACGAGCCGGDASSSTAASGHIAHSPTDDSCGSDACGTEACATAAPRVPVLACRDALVAAGARVDTVTAGSDAEIDAVIARLDGPPRPDGLSWPAADAPTLVLAVSSDAQLRAVIRRVIRRYAPPPSRRPADLPAGRTIPDLPTIAILPLDPARPTVRPDLDDLADQLGLVRDPSDVAKAVLGGHTRRIDVFRNDGGSVTLHGALLGGVDETGNAAPWLTRVELDDHVLTDGTEPVLAVAVANASGYAHLDELPLAPGADASSGTIAVAVAVPVVTRGRFGRRSVRIEIRRATGRAVSVNPAGEVPFVDDGVAGTLTRKRAWWVEPGALPIATL